MCYRSTVPGDQIVKEERHMDEKWFFAIVVRRNNKSVPFLGVAPVHHAVHHKSHIDKLMVIASTAFLPLGNDMTKGGEARRVSCVRVGAMRPAAKDTYKRVYKPDGGFHYPKIEENRLRKKGELYFKAMEVTGSRVGTAKNPKFSLLKYFMETEIRNMDELAKEIYEKTGKRVIMRYQMDGAGPHTDKKLLDGINSEFDKRGWILSFQPSNSPLTNVKDYCIFPAMSKAVTAMQGLKNGSLVIDNEELWSYVENVWKDLSVETIARAYASHHQIANAIAVDKGGDAFVRDKKALHFGIRKNSIPFYANDDDEEPSGVEMIESIDYEGDGEDINTLRYARPDISGLDMVNFLSDQELGVLFDNLEEDSDEWLRVATAIATKNLPEESDTEMEGEGDNGDESDGDDEIDDGDDEIDDGDN
jgi:hypothetical protein